MDSDSVAVSALDQLVKIPIPDRHTLLDMLLSGECKSVKSAKNRLSDMKAAALAAQREAQILDIMSSVRLYCGDCLEQLRQVGDSSVHCVIIDPPYGLEVHNTRSGEKDYADGYDYAFDLLDDVCCELNRVCVKGAHVYVFAGSDFRLSGKVYDIMSDYFTMQDWPIVWQKDNHTMCDFKKWYPRKHEPIVFGHNVEPCRELRKCIPDVITCPRDNNTGHSAEKPIALLEALIKQSTTTGETVLDCFMGAGSTGVAAVRQKRTFIGIELEQRWHDVAKGRMVEEASDGV